MPKISILMGVYNTPRPEVLQAAMQSVYAQSCRDFEFIICDDGSTDHTPELLRAYSKGEEARTILLPSQGNHGLAAALNRCLDAASGEYIARMDADDVSYPERLARQAAFLDSHPQFALVGCQADLFDDGGVWGERRPKEYPEKRDFLFGSQFMHPTILMHRQVLCGLGGYRADAITRLAEDYDLFMRLYAAGWRGCNLPEKLYAYREDPAALRRRTWRRRWEEAQVRWRGFGELGLMPLGALYAAKPLLVGLIPQGLLRRLRGEKARPGKPSL